LTFVENDHNKQLQRYCVIIEYTTEYLIFCSKTLICSQILQFYCVPLEKL